MKRKLKEWYLRLVAPGKDTLAAIGEDFRKLGITAASVGIIGLAVAGDTITEDEAALILAVGFILWLYGIILTKVGNS